MIRTIETKQPPRAAAEPRDPILPPATIGILGGGQLGRMLAMAARTLGYGIAVLDPDPECPAAGVADRVVVGRYDDAAAATALAAGSAIVTYELEHISASVVEELEAVLPVRPGGNSLRVTQDRLAERRFLENAGAAVAPWREVTTEEDIATAAATLGFPLRLKAAFGGYDGRSQIRLADAADVPRALGRLGRPPQTRLLLERELEFAAELSVVVARGVGGETRAYPVGRNVHDAGILVESVAPAPTAARMAQRATALATTLAAALDHVGVLTVELFAMPDGSLIVNELAPRVHNSGHWTIEAAATSQFAQHVRAICGLPLGSVEMHGAAATVNLLGTGRDRPARPIGLDTALGTDVAVHLYGKRRVFDRRKMGHVTAVSPSGDAEAALARARAAASAIAWADEAE